MTLKITEKGKKYIEERKAKSPEMAALCKKMEELVQELPLDRKALIKAVYDEASRESVSKDAIIGDTPQTRDGIT